MVLEISREELRRRLDSGENLVIVEALPALYYEDAHLPGALNLPHDQVDELAPALLPDENQAVVVYCSNRPCQNSLIAARRLVELGYTRVYDYADGKQDWIEAGLPVQRGRQAV